MSKYYDLFHSTEHGYRIERIDEVAPEGYTDLHAELEFLSDLREEDDYALGVRIRWVTALLEELYPGSEWKREVSNGDTNLGLGDWRTHQYEAVINQ